MLLHSNFFLVVRSHEGRGGKLREAKESPMPFADGDDTYKGTLGAGVKQAVLHIYDGGGRGGGT